MADLEHEASTQGDTGTTLRQRQPQGSIVATLLFIYFLLNHSRYYLLHELLTFEWNKCRCQFCPWRVWLVVKKYNVNKESL